MEVEDMDAHMKEMHICSQCGMEVDNMDDHMSEMHPS
jgi:hypothetical protein